ncbi:TPA: hypothetical protein NQG77_000243 [Salmonella enterica subsp. enterica serovar Infantis]|uniref:hypothetical protein n=1 Tax=Salmonella enterica TaxID=28901 RepID=UPI003163991C|nr:hypothetical protein [Salmonella enterica subsp. enterica serovar Infantis]HCK0320621.1 hypothetical protein [Salmonella enterica subsp. enterica serovar Infantis]
MGELLASITGAFKGASSDTIVKSVMGAMGMMSRSHRTRQATSHSNVQATPFHYQSNANPITALKDGFDYMKNDIDVSKGFNDVKNLF